MEQANLTMEDILRLVTVPVEEDQINTPDCSPGAFIRQDDTLMPSNLKMTTYDDEDNTPRQFEY